MRSFSNSATLCLLLLGTAAPAQNIRPEYRAQPTSEAPVIDGLLDEKTWATAPLATNFTTYSPTPGLPSPFRTEVRLLFDADALYVAARLLDDEPERILQQFTPRDQTGLNDDFGVNFDTYHDGQNAFRFKITAAGQQIDWRASPGVADYAWDAVWQSAVRRNSEGWVAEIRIPFSAVRFARQDVQHWGLQFTRFVARTGEFSTWSSVDPSIRNAFPQWGTLTGMDGLRPPVRLSLSPYLSAGLRREPADNGALSTRMNYGGGLDLKYGLNESFTLDLSLVPDFSQVQSDDRVLNLTPFEIEYEERRQFFTEGTELFGKAGVFYSRRIGAQPHGYFGAAAQRGDHERLVENPATAGILNAAKISGRTKGGLGIGVLNAVTSEERAVFENTLDGTRRRLQTEPLTNYNVVVFDQSLKNSSWLSLTNTHVWRSGAAPDAGVTALNFNLRDKKITYSLSGDAKISTRTGQPAGYAARLSMGKISGFTRFDLENRIASPRYDPNDLGLNFFNNFIENHVSAGLTQFKPAQARFKNWNASLGAILRHRFDDRAFEHLALEAKAGALFSSFWTFNVMAEVYPVHRFDYYGAFAAGRKFRLPAGSWEASLMILSDTRQQMQGNAFLTIGSQGFAGSRSANLDFTLLLNFSEKWQVSTSHSAGKDWKQRGFAAFDSSGASLFGQRDVRSVTHVLALEWRPSTRFSTSLRARYFWSGVRYDAFFPLIDDGTLGPVAPPDRQADENFNTFNLDLVLNWQFAPGSFLTLSWKNNLFQSDSLGADGWWDNLGKTFGEPTTNALTVKALYYFNWAD